MTRTELDHYQANNKATSRSTHETIDGIKYVSMEKNGQYICFKNGKRITLSEYIGRGRADGIRKVIVNYDYLNNHVRMTLIDNTLESIRREYLNSDGVNIIEITEHFELKGDK